MSDDDVRLAEELRARDRDGAAVALRRLVGAVTDALNLLAVDIKNEPQAFDMLEDALALARESMP